MIFSNDTLKNTTTMDRMIYAEICRSLQKMSNSYSSSEGKVISFRCHSICRALSMFLGPDFVTLRDGHCFGISQLNADKKEELEISPVFCRHSWLVTCDGSIIDPYPVGTYSWSPLLFVKDGDYAAYSQGRYFEDVSVTQAITGREISRESSVILRMLSLATGLKPQSQTW